jgi:phosphonate metabolism protein (transferase hexapeptide repeat family)
MLQYIEAYPEEKAGPVNAGANGRARKLGEQPHIHPTARVSRSEIGSWTSIGPNCSVRESTFGDYSYAAGDASIIWSDIGSFCSIASHVRVNPGNHPHWRVTQNHCTYRRAQYGFGEDDEEFFAWRRSDRCRIGHDVWIGHGAIVLPGASVATGAVVGAGAVVTKKRPIGPYEIAVGAPARLVRKRFPDRIIEQLLEIGYWNWDRQTLEERFDDLLDIEAFVEKYSC